MQIVSCRMCCMYTCTAHVTCFKVEGQDRGLSSARGGSRVFLIRNSTTPNDPNKDESCSLMPKSWGVLPSLTEQMGPAFDFYNVTRPYGIVYIDKSINRETSSDLLCLVMSMVKVSNRRVCVASVSTSWCCTNSSNFWALCSFNSSVCREPCWWSKVTFSVLCQVHLYKLVCGDLLFTWTKSGQHCADGLLPDRRTQTLDGIQFSLTKTRITITRVVKAIVITILHFHVG